MSAPRPVVLGTRYFLAHTPNLVRYGSKPTRELARDPALGPALAAHLRPYADAVAYAPNRAFLGALDPDALADLPQPWYRQTTGGERWGPLGELMPEPEFLGMMRALDEFDLLWLEEGFAREVADALAAHPLVGEADRKKIVGRPASAIEAQLAKQDEGSLPLYVGPDRLVGCINRAHEQDATLVSDVLLENLACKASAVMALRTVLAQRGIPAASVDYVLGSGEEAVGERYQRGGGNLAKAIAEGCDCVGATGSDVKAFCCGPVHALVIAAGLVASGVFQTVAVVGGCSLAKLGMKFQGHLRHDMPVLEDVLAGMAVVVGPEDGRAPVIRLDSIGRHPVAAGSSQQAIFEKLVAEPLGRLGWRFGDVDKYATELHNPEVTEPAGSGNVPALNYRVIASLAAVRKEITPAELPAFVRRHGMPGYSPTQGHIASAVPYIGPALAKMEAGEIRRAMFLAKGSLFLGRMTQLSDGMSFVVEKE